MKPEAAHAVTELDLTTQILLLDFIPTDLIIETTTSAC
jgi:hypothetical protein